MIPRGGPAACRQPRYNRSMARGWESKDVEAQKDMRAAQGKKGSMTLTQEQREIQMKRDSLDSTRRRVLADLDRATHPRHQAQLREALAHLESEIARLS